MIVVTRTTASGPVTIEVDADSMTVQSGGQPGSFFAQVLVLHKKDAENVGKVVAMFTDWTYVVKVEDAS